MMRKLSALFALALFSCLGLAQSVTSDPLQTGIYGGTVTSVACGTPTQGVTCSVTSATGAPVVTIGLSSVISTSVNGTATTASYSVNAGTSSFATTAGSATSATTAGNATTVTTNANLTGPVSSTGNTTTLTASTGSGSTIVLQSSPTLNTPTLGIPKLSTQTWANLPAAAVGNSGAFTIASDLGTNGSIVASNGARWRPWNGFTVLNSMAASTSSIAATETFVCQTLLPTNSWQTNDIIRIWLSETKSGATDNGQVTVRVGTAGTTADTAITGLSAFPFLGSTGLAQAGTWDIKLISATSAQKLGNNSNTSSAYGGVGAVAEAVATTITSAAANPLWVSVSIKSSATNNTVGAGVCRIELHASP